MKYAKPIMDIIMIAAIHDIVTLSGTEGDGTEFDPSTLSLDMDTGWTT